MALLLPVYAGGANAALKYGALGSVAAASLLSGLDRRLPLAAHEESQRRLACYRRDPQAVDYDVNGHHGHGTAEASLALAWKVHFAWHTPRQQRRHKLQGVVTKWCRSAAVRGDFIGTI